MEKTKITQENLRLMKQIHSQGLQHVSSDVQRLRGFVNDYERLVGTLTALPTKTHHDALIPLGGAALMPGRLIHTNEVLVLLGDNWFVERTAAEARDIVNRRLADCRNQLNRVQEAAKLQSNWITKTSELENDQGIDIVEEVTEEEYSAQQARHREMVKVHHLKLRQQREKKLQQTPSQQTPSRRQAPTATAASEQVLVAARRADHEADMKRLDNLEELERDEDSEQEEEASGDGSGLESLEDNLSEESTDSDDDSDDEQENPRKPGDKEEEEEDSEDDLPVSLNKFKHVKIESPMPSADRRFNYSDECQAEGAAAGDDGDDTLGDIDKVEQVIRGRSRSFTRSVDVEERGATARSDYFGRDSSADSRKDGSEPSFKGKAPVTRRVSWADQSPYLISDQSGAAKILYVATGADALPKNETREVSVEESSSVSRKSNEQSTCSSEGETCKDKPDAPPSTDSNTLEATSSFGEETKSTCAITSPADLVKLTLGGTKAEQAQVVSEVAQKVEAASFATSSVEAVTAAASDALLALTAKPKKSILKKMSSQDVMMVPADAAVSSAASGGSVSWLHSTDSVPITNLPLEEPLPPQFAPQEVKPAFTYRVIARDVDDPAPPTAAAAAAAPSTTSQNPPKKMSKFKASRLKP